MADGEGKKMLKIQHTPLQNQPELFPIIYQGVMKSHGETRNRVGDRVEDLTCKVLGLRNIPINGNYDVNLTLYECADPYSKEYDKNWREKIQELKENKGFGNWEVNLFKCCEVE